MDFSEIFRRDQRLYKEVGGVRGCTRKQEGSGVVQRTRKVQGLYNIQMISFWMTSLGHRPPLMTKGIITGLLI